MDVLFEELSLSLPDVRELARIGIRLLGALIVGAVIGLQRELTGKAAGLRTHMLVALGTTLVVLVGVEYGMGDDAMSRVIQGVMTGIGFLGAGAILKIVGDKEIHGLTTAAGIWFTAAAGVAAGLGRLGPAVIGVAVAWVVLATLPKVETLLHGEERPAPREGDG